MSSRTIFYSFLLFVLAGCGGGNGSSSSTTTPDSPSSNQTSLQVDQFGQGKIVDAAGNVVCTGSNCTVSYKNGEVVVLSANPADGWTLNNWLGCDSVKDNKCTVTVTANKLVNPTFQKSAAPVLKNNVVLLDATDMGYFVEARTDVLVFSGAATKIAALKKGDIVVSTQNSGFAKKVLNVVVVPGGNILVDTMNASLDEIVQDGAFVMNKALKSSDLVSTKLANGILAVDAGDDFITLKLDNVIVDQDGDEKTVGDQVALKGEAKIKLNPEVALDIGWHGLNEFKSILYSDIQSDISVVASPGAKKFEKEKLIDAGILKFAPIVVGPVVFVPTVKLFLEATGEAGVAIKISGKMGIAGSLGVHYLREGGWKGIGDAQTSGDFQLPAIEGTAEANLGAGVVSHIWIYDVAGPFIKVGPYVKGEAKIQPTSDPTYGGCGRASIEVGGRAKAGGEMKVFAWNLGKYEAVLLASGKKLLDTQYGACKDEESPKLGGAVTIDSQTSNQITLAWPSATDNVAVARYDIYRNHSKVGSSVSPSYLDGGLEENKDYCYYIVAADAAGNVSVPSAAVCGKTRAKLDSAAPTTPAGLAGQALSTSAIRLSWSPASDNVAVAGYIVTEGDVIVAATTSTTTVDVLKLTANSEYCYSVSAYDDAGNVSEKSQKVCTKTLPKSNSAWIMKIKCASQSRYVVEDYIDLDEASTQNISVMGSATDYSGTGMAYYISGAYDNAQKILSGNITWTFSNSSNVRLDQFSGTLSTNDTGDINMTQVKVTGCNAQIRFIRNTGATNVLSHQSSLDEKGFGSISSR